jgi:hypothetical protein
VAADIFPLENFCLGIDTHPDFCSKGTEVTFAGSKEIRE